MGTAPLVTAERVVGLVRGGVSLAAPVALPGERVPGALGPGQLVTAAELPEVQVGLGYPAPPFGPPVRQGARRAEVGGAAGAGQFADVGGDPLQDRGHPWQVDRHQRLIGVIAVGAQVDRRGVLAGVQVGQPIGALADPADLIDQAVADQVTPVQLGVVIRIGVFGVGSARGPQLPQGDIQLVHVRGRRDLVHPGRGQCRRGRQLADRDPFRTGRGQRPGALPPGLIQAPGRPRYPPQHPPFPPAGHHPVRDRHDHTPAGVQRTRQLKAVRGAVLTSTRKPRC
jgi:hypothetical protein